MFFNLVLLSAWFQPVNLYPASEAGFCDVFGNVWEWIEDHFNGLGDFKAHLLYDDFSTPCFDGRHNMIMVCDLLNVIGHFRVPLCLCFKASLKAGFHMIADDRRSQKVLRSSAIVCDCAIIWKWPIRFAQSHRTETIRSTNQNANQIHVAGAKCGKTLRSE